MPGRFLHELFKLLVRRDTCQFRRIRNNWVYVLRLSGKMRVIKKAYQQLCLPFHICSHIFFSHLLIDVSLKDRCILYPISWVTFGKFQMEIWWSCFRKFQEMKVTHFPCPLELPQRTHRGQLWQACWWIWFVYGTARIGESCLQSFLITKDNTVCSFSILKIICSLIKDYSTGSFFIFSKF